MSDYFWLREDQLARIKPYFPLSHGVPRVDDRRVLSGIIHMLKRGLQWRDAPVEYGPHKTLYNRFIRWSRLGVFDRIFKELSSRDTLEQLQIDAMHPLPGSGLPANHERVKAHRTASSLLKKGMFPVTFTAWQVIGTITEKGPHKGWIEFQATCGLRRPWKAGSYASDGGSGVRL